MDVTVRSAGAVYEQASIINPCEAKIKLYSLFEIATRLIKIMPAGKFLLTKL